MRARDATRWSVLLTVREPVAVQWLAGVQALVAAVCVAVALSRVATVWCVLACAALCLALWLTLRWRRGAAYRWQDGRARPSGSLPSDALQLATDANGRWVLREPRGRAWHVVVPTRVWRGPGWVTLRLSAVATPGSAMADAISDHAVAATSSRGAPQRVWTVTLWRAALGLEDWRKLSVLLRTLRQPATTPPAATPA